MLIIVSNPVMFENEPTVVNQLFAAGMGLFHLRKPEAGEDEVRNLLSAIDKTFLSQVVLHQHHALASEFGISRIHFKENDRLKLTERDYRRMAESKLVYSTSVHSTDAYLQLNDVFQYAFYGPVFESISKPGYKPEKEMEVAFEKYKSVKLIGIGGVTAHNAASVYDKGFDGVAVCGTIWQSEDKVATFEKVNTRCKTSDLTY